MRTIGHKYHGPQYNWEEKCDYCGAHWHRSELAKDADHLLRCPHCIDGKTLLELSIEKASATNGIQPVRAKTRDDI